MKFLLKLVMFFLLSNGYATAQSLIQDSCKKAAATNPKFKYNFCVKSLQENPKSKTAKNLAGLVMAATENAVSKTKSLKATVAKILKDKKYGKENEMPLQDCLELYSNADGSLQEALTSVKSRDYNTANVKLSAAMDAPTTCETGFKERRTPQKSPVTKDNDALFQMISIPLAFTKMVK